MLLISWMNWEQKCNLPSGCNWRNKKMIYIVRFTVIIISTYFKYIIGRKIKWKYSWTRFFVLKFWNRMFRMSLLYEIHIFHVNNTHYVRNINGRRWIFTRIIICFLFITVILPENYAIKIILNLMMLNHSIALKCGFLTSIIKIGNLLNNMYCCLKQQNFMQLKYNF